MCFESSPGPQGTVAWGNPNTICVFWWCVWILTGVADSKALVAGGVIKRPVQVNLVCSASNTEGRWIVSTQRNEQWTLSWWTCRIKQSIKLPCMWCISGAQVSIVNLKFIKSDLLKVGVHMNLRIPPPQKKNNPQKNNTFYVYYIIFYFRFYFELNFFLHLAHLFLSLSVATDLTNFKLTCLPPAVIPVVCFWCVSVTT